MQASSAYQNAALFRRKGQALARHQLGYGEQTHPETGEQFFHHGIDFPVRYRMLAAVAELERSNIKARQMAGIERARAQGKKLGAPKVIDDAAVAAWRKKNGASIADTAKHWGISTAAVKRACRGPRVQEAAA